MVKRGTRKGQGLTLSFLTYGEMNKLDSVKRVKRILDTVIKNRIVILQGRLGVEEEASLIQSTMILVGWIKNFKGIEIEVITPSAQESFLDKMRSGVAKALVGQRDILTIIGPAAIVKKIKKDPSKIDLMLKR